MSINKALKDLKWSFENKFKDKLSDRDIEAYKTIVGFVETQHSVNLTQNEALAKLWIHQLILLNSTELYDAKRSIEVIDEILSKSVYEWCLEMQKQANIMRFKTLLNNERYKDALKNNKPLKAQEIGSEIIEGKEKEFNEALTKDITEESVIKFVEDNITRLINTK
ncbi:hypothetical protein [Seonamhaeicola sp.]|uniref:hypothetical protein n=1 Tax=Seonamhaeicola sp. TaxID=1912245 RepID=UPI00356727FD